MLIFSIIVYVAFGILGIYFIISGSKKLQEKKRESEFSSLYENEREYEAALAETKINFDEKYFERIRNGERSQQFLSIGGIKDCVMIRSLLYAENIPTYTENENINKIYSLSPDASSDSPFAIKMFILIADYDKAYEIVSSYVESMNEKNKKSSETEDKSAETAEKTSDNPVNPITETSEPVTTGMFFTLVSDDVEPKTIGIQVLPKFVED